MKKEIELPIEEIVEKYKNGITQSKIATEYGVTQATISSKIKKYYKSLGVEVIKRKNKAKKRIELPIKEIIEKYEQGISEPKLAVEYNVTQATISRRIIEYYKEIGQEKPKPNIEYPRIKLPIEEMIEKLEGTSVTQIELAKEYNVSEATISARIREYYKNTNKEKPLSSRRYTRPRKELPIEEIVKRYEEGNSPIDISKEYNVGRTTILNRLNEYYQKQGREKPKIEYKKKPGQERIELPIYEIIKKDEKGVPSSELAKEYNISEFTIRARIREYYETTGSDRVKHKTGQKRKELPIDEIIKKYEEGTEIKEIARGYNVSYSAINTRIRDYYKNNGKEKPKINSARKQLLKEHIIKEYKSGKKQAYLVKKYGVSQTTISAIIREYYLENGIEVQKKKELPIDEIIKEYENGNKQVYLAQKYGVSQGTISKIIREYYLEIEVHKKKEIPIEEMIEKYERGISKSTLAEEYNIAYNTILQRIKKYYKESGRKEPKKLKSESVIVEYLKKGLTIEEILETASKKNVIIPQELISAAVNKVNNKNISDDNEER